MVLDHWIRNRNPCLDPWVNGECSGAATDPGHSNGVASSGPSGNLMVAGHARSDHMAS